MNKQVDVSAETAAPDQNEKVLSPKEASIDKIKTAFWAAIFLSVINIGIIILNFNDVNSPLSEMLTALADPLSYILLAFWLLKGKSRIAAILLLSLFLLGKLVLLLPILGLIDASFTSALIRQLVSIVIFGWAFLQGILGTFAFHRLIKSGDMDDEFDLLRDKKELDGRSDKILKK